MKSNNALIFILLLSALFSLSLISLGLWFGYGFWIGVWLGGSYSIAGLSCFIRKKAA